MRTIPVLVVYRRLAHPRILYSQASKAGQQTANLRQARSDLLIVLGEFKCSFRLFSGVLRFVRSFSAFKTERFTFEVRYGLGRIDGEAEEAPRRTHVRPSREGQV